MKWAGDGMNIFRLSLFNLKKNRREAAGIAVLTFITAFLLSTFAANITGIEKAFDRSFDASGCREYSIAIDSSAYRDSYYDILAEDPDVSDLLIIHAPISETAKTIDSDGKGMSSTPVVFISEADERKIEDYAVTSTLPEDEISALDHPIRLPEYYHITAGFDIGDTFTVIYGGNKYPFTIAAFYNGGLWCDNGNGLRLIVSEDDKLALSPLFKEYNIIFFDHNDTDGEFIYNRYAELCKERTGESLDGWLSSKSDSRMVALQYLYLFLYMSAGLSLVTLAASLFMIRHKISKDIEDQMQQIGVLEAIGYKSTEISLSYVYEYVITGGIGAVTGGIAAALFTPVMTYMSMAMMSRTVSIDTNFGRIFLVILLTLLAVILFALIKAGIIKSFPPVTAFRKGIKTHHFGRNFLPLEGLKKSINLRLALKGIASDISSNIGVGICIALAGTAMLFSAYTFDFFKNGSDNLVRTFGIEMADTRIAVMDSADPQKMREELLAMPEVRKVLITSAFLDKVDVKGSDLEARIAVYDDFSETENIKTIDGRLPVYENEIAVSLRRHREENMNIGDSIIVQGDIEQSYIITGIVNNMALNRSVLYITTDGYRRIMPTARTRTIDVYLSDGYTREAFEEKLTEFYGANVQDSMSADGCDGDLEERIRRRADETMAKLITQYGVTDADYAIRIGDTIINGNSTRFIIKELSSMKDMVKSQADPIAGITRAFAFGAVFFIMAVVAVILGIITSSNVKRQKKELGIMKSLGYTSKDLMTQTALRTLPVAVISVITAAVISVIINKYFWILVFTCTVKQNYALTIGVSIAIVVFTYIFTYIGAGNIRKVSVTELMTE